MIRETLNALAACVVSFALCTVAYPAAVWGLAWVAFPDQAEGSLIRSRDRATVIGSSLVAQPFASDRYFSPRPSAVDYNASATGGSNLGTNNPDLRKKVAERAEALKATVESPAPVELVSASGGGLDPHITPEGARYQAARVAAARALPLARVRELIDAHVDRSGAILGAPERVNVLLLNRALDEEKPAAGPTPSPAPEPTPTAAATPEPEATPGRVEALADELKDVKVRLAGLAGSPAVPPELARKVDEAAGQIAAADRRIEALQREVRSLKAADDVDGKLTALRAEVDALRNRPAAATPTPTPSPSAPAPDFDTARALFRSKQYASASDAFKALAEAEPDDARAWYYAALSRALATRQWRGEPEQLAWKGVERERAGTPPAAQIDRDLAGLAPDTGRDWLAFFRKRAANANP